MMRLFSLFLLLLSPVFAEAQMFTKADSLRGNYGRFRANNDLLYYDLRIRIDPVAEQIFGSNTIRFRMLAADNRIQLDLYENLKIEKVEYANQEVSYVRDGNAFFVTFPQMLPKGSEQVVTVHYRGKPKATSRFGGFVFGKDPAGNPWIYSSCEDVGAQVWWPNKEQWKDEPEGMRLRVAVPNGLTNVSNGRLMGTKDLGDGYTEFDYVVHYPINNYNVSVNVGKYVHFGEKYKDLTLDYYVLEPNLDKARIQFSQVKPMMGCFEKHFGPYPFPKDGFKLIEVPYSGMEHQSAVTYGNRFANGYLERDWTGVGISPRFDFIIIHESGHEWFGNSVSAADRADMWIHEALDTYAEAVYVECMWNYEDAMRYVNGYAPKVAHKEPVIGPYGVSKPGAGGDMYFKGTLVFNTLRHVLRNDVRWWNLWREYNRRFKYQNIHAEQVIAFFNEQFKQNLTPIFNQYLRYPQIPTLELKYHGKDLQYRWVTDVKYFRMPVELMVNGKVRRLMATNQWKTLTNAPKSAVQVRTDLFYVNVREVAN
ncbi:MAG: M1 family metallopeptidase [Bacteroidetes Order II. Incertae sedis bacterium]|nr:M1 family metallopeptidase [Bacteroidetes Order II. bacterium]